MSSEFHVLGNTVECPRKYSGMSSEIQGMSSMSSEIQGTGMSSMPSEIQRELSRGSAAQNTPPGFGFFWECPRKYRNVLENAKMSRIFPHVLENPKSYLSSELQTFDAHLGAIFYWEGISFLRSANELVRYDNKISEIHEICFFFLGKKNTD